MQRFNFLYLILQVVFQHRLSLGGSEGTKSINTCMLGKLNAKALNSNFLQFVIFNLFKTQNSSIILFPSVFIIASNYYFIFYSRNILSLPYSNNASKVVMYLLEIIFLIHLSHMGVPHNLTL